jgi:hypothetical protein
MPRRLASIIISEATPPALADEIRLLAELAQMPASHRESIRRMVDVLRSFGGAVPPGLRFAIDELFESRLSDDDRYQKLDTILAAWTTHH